MMVPWVALLLVAMILADVVVMVLGSVGDQSYINHLCMSACDTRNCAGVADEVYAATQPIYLQWLGWNCFEECGYNCMWKTVEAFKRDGSPIPQFHGKWPFMRLLGIQEPASVLFSILNAIPHIVMMIKFRRVVPSKAPMYYIWHSYAVVGINAWFWSTIFHARDFKFTELMDYLGAISLIMFSIFVLCARVVGRRPAWRLLGCALLLTLFFTYHMHYLAFVKFDYGYNIKAMVTVGVLNSVGWLVWCSRVRQQQRYVWKMAACMMALNLLVLLEVFDFPPIWWALDAHALWHAGTVPVCFLWYSAIIDDCLYLASEQQKQTKDD